jgi:hypothetical protein
MTETAKNAKKKHAIDALLGDLGAWRFKLLDALSVGGGPSLTLRVGVADHKM